MIELIETEKGTVDLTPASLEIKSLLTSIFPGRVGSDVYFEDQIPADFPSRDLKAGFIASIRKANGSTPGVFSDNPLPPQRDKRLFRQITSPGKQSSAEGTLFGLKAESENILLWPQLLDRSLSRLDHYATAIISDGSGSSAVIKRPSAAWFGVRLHRYFESDTRDIVISYITVAWWLNLHATSYSFEYVPLGPRRPRIYGQKDSPSWRKFHKEWSDGRKFTKHQAKLVESPNENGFGNDNDGKSQMSEFYDKAKKVVSKAVTQGLSAGLRSGAKKIGERTVEQSPSGIRKKIRKSIQAKLREVNRKR